MERENEAKKALANVIVVQLSITVNWTEQIELGKRASLDDFPNLAFRFPR